MKPVASILQNSKSSAIIRILVSALFSYVEAFPTDIGHHADIFNLQNPVGLEIS